MPTYEEVMGALAEQGLGNFDPYGGAVAGPPGALADHTFIQSLGARSRCGALRRQATRRTAG